MTSKDYLSVFVFVKGFGLGVSFTLGDRENTARKICQTLEGSSV
jgi:hypothetical protein